MSIDQPEGKKHIKGVINVPTPIFCVAILIFSAMGIGLVWLKSVREDERRMLMWYVHRIVDEKDEEFIDNGGLLTKKTSRSTSIA